jgi:hypothetical protein
MGPAELGERRDIHLFADGRQLGFIRQQACRA